MKLISFDGFVWGNSGYAVSTNDAAMLVNSVEATVLPRPGTYPTFGLAQIGAMYLPCEILYTGALTFEAAFLNFWKRINPANIDPPRDLQAQRNDGVVITIKAVATIPQVSDTGEVNVKSMTFVCCEPFWVQNSYTTATGGYS